jgi:hypothetical protein
VLLEPQAQLVLRVLKVLTVRQVLPELPVLLEPQAQLVLRVHREQPEQIYWLLYTSLSTVASKLNTLNNYF